MQVDISGIQKAMAQNQRMIAELQPSGAAGRGLKAALIAAHREITAVTHVGKLHDKYRGGSLRASFRMKLDLGALEGVINIDPSSRNPNNNTRPAEYGVYEVQRGGSHDFLSEAIRLKGRQIIREFAAEIMRAVQQA